MEACHAAPGCRDQEVGDVVAVDVAQRDRVEAERVAGNAARVGLGQAAVLVRVETAPGAGGASGHRPTTSSATASPSPSPAAEGLVPNPLPAVSPVNVNSRRPSE